MTCWFFDVEVDHFAHQDVDVLGSFKNGSQRRRDVCRCKDPGGNLVKQRLKNVVVATVDQRHVGVHFSQVQCRM